VTRLSINANPVMLLKKHGVFMKISSLLAGLVLLSGQSMADDNTFLYEGFSKVSQSEIVSVFRTHGLTPDRVSSEHFLVLSALYKSKGIDFIGLVEDRDEANYSIQENPYWILNGYEQFASGRMNKRSQIDIDSLRTVLVRINTCLEIVKVGPENYSLEEVHNDDRYHSNADYICPGTH
jgi:hypothetical protein